MSDAAKIQRREHSEGRRITVCVTLFTVCVFAQNLPGCAFFYLVFLSNPTLCVNLQADS